MASSYSSRHSKPLGGNRHALGGAGLNLPIDALIGDTEMVLTFDDFNQCIETSGRVTVGALGLKALGWTVTQVTGAAGGGFLHVNDVATGQGFTSCIEGDMGTTADEGTNMQFDNPATVRGSEVMPAINLGSGATVGGLDNTVWVLACRFGYHVNAFPVDGKIFIGWAGNGDVDVLDPATGILSLVAGGSGIQNPVMGFHLNCDPAVTPNLSLIAQRTHGTALAEGTNFTNFLSGTQIPINVATGMTQVDDVIWFDCALRCVITDESDNADNGSVEGFFRRVPNTGGIRPGSTQIAGLRENNAADANSVPFAEWQQHPTVLLNQCPNVAGINELRPTIEVINGPVNNLDFFVDWWLMGRSRFSRSRGNLA